MQAGSYENEVYPLLTDVERQQLAAWNATLRTYPRDACVPQLVALQARLRPDTVALVDGDQRLSYRELNLRANRLAHHLRTLNVGPNVLVGLCAERSPDMVVGLLGILKAGGAYVPLDPSYPPDRLAFMIEDAQVPVLVTQQRLAARLAAGNTRLVYLDAPEQLPGDDPPVSVPPSDLAYVIYTSGSTGRPKGVQITHDSLLNLVYWHQRAFTVTPDDRATQFASPAFDATGWELWPYLTIGASVYLFNEDARVSPERCRDWLIQNGITITFLPTSMAESVMTLAWPATTSLRFLLTGADALHQYPPSTLPFTLVNNYGPTEATVVVTSAPVAPTEQADAPPSIGRPIDNTQIYILDEQLRQTPIGVPGELHIGGLGLAKGYLNRPELTAEKFIAHPFSNEPGARLYKTGDLARWLPDGQIAFLGRLDHQIKIRGYRIEPGEIASALDSLPAVQTSVVIAREDTPSDKRLVAYIVPVPCARVSASLLRNMLAKRLPDYMIPATFVQLDALPLTPNGKVNRDALPAPDPANTVGDDAVALPGTATEVRLHSLVAPLLGLEQVGVDDNFFLLGGTSMMGTQLIVLVNESFGVNVPLRLLFQIPTIRRLAAEIERRVLAMFETMSDEEIANLLQQTREA
jgi:amino acid adenylation domain-containing protein